MENGEVYEAGDFFWHNHWRYPQDFGGWSSRWLFAEKIPRKEGANINKSLSALGNVWAPDRMQIGQTLEDGDDSPVDGMGVVP